MMRRQKFNLEVKTAAVRLVVSLNEAKAHLGIDDSDISQDANLMGDIRAAILAVEAHTARALITQTFTMYLDKFPGRLLPWWDGVREIADTELTDLDQPITIPRPPLQSITHIKAWDTGGVATTVTASNYIVDSTSAPGRVALKQSQAWPAVALRTINGVEIEFIAGYGAAGSTVPQDIREAILALLSNIYESLPGGGAIKREVTGESEVTYGDSGGFSKFSRLTQGLLSPYRVTRF